MKSGACRKRKRAASQESNAHAPTLEESERAILAKWDEARAAEWRRFAVERVNSDDCHLAAHLRGESAVVSILVKAVAERLELFHQSATSGLATDEESVSHETLFATRAHPWLIRRAF